MENNLQQAVDAIYELGDIVASTLGPGGRTVIINDDDETIVTKDGVTVASACDSDNPVRKAGIELVKQASRKTVEQAGDGTTTSTVLAAAIIKEGMTFINSGVNPIVIKEGIERAVEDVVTYISKTAIPVEDNLARMINVATISTNNDAELGHLLATAVHNCKDGLIKADRAEDGKTSVTYDKGITIRERGYLNPMFVNESATQTCILKNVRILITDKSIANPNEFLKICDAVATRKESLLIVATEVSAEALGFLLSNRKHLNSCVIQAPSYGFTRTRTMEDLAIATGGTFFVEVTNPLKLASYEDLGFASEVVVHRDFTSISGFDGDVSERCKSIAEQMENTKDPVDLESLKSRLSNLNGKNATIKIGGLTDAEFNETKDRVDDGLKALYSAVEEGVVPGCGIVFLRASKAIDGLIPDSNELSTGYKIVQKAIKRPFNQILENIGLTPGEYSLQSIEKVFNARTREFEDDDKTVVLDPAKVSRVALENAASIAISVLISRKVLWRKSL